MNKNSMLKIMHKYLVDILSELKWRWKTDQFTYIGYREWMNVGLYELFLWSGEIFQQRGVSNIVLNWSCFTCRHSHFGRLKFRKIPAGILKHNLSNYTLLYYSLIVSYNEICPKNVLWCSRIIWDSYFF